MDDLSRYLKIFRDEAVEHIQSMRSELLGLEQDPSRLDRVKNITRAAHTIKGSSRMVGLTPVGDLAHRMEDVLKGIEKGRIRVDSALVDLLLEAADAVLASIEAAASGGEGPSLDSLSERISAAAMQPAAAAPPAAVVAEQAVHPDAERPARAMKAAGLLNELDSLFGSGETPPEQADAPKPAASAASAPPIPPPAEPAEAVAERPRKEETAFKPAKGVQSAGDTIRVDVQKLDVLTDLAGELMINKIKIENKYHAVKALSKSIAAELGVLQPGKAEAAKLAAASVSILESVKALTDEFFRDYKEMETLATELQTTTLDMRLLPVSTIFDAYHRTVRDLRQTLGKDVVLTVSGRETLLDKRILEEINPALVHLIRNAVDHGIEMPAARAAAGKPATGTVTLEAFNRGGDVVIRVTDDGAGIDIQKVLKKAVEKGLVSAEEAKGMSEADVRNMVFKYGFSTSAMITDVSGRGVGLNVVWERVAELKGNVVLDSEPGRGTSVSLSFPPTYFTSNVLLVKICSEILAIPSNFLAEILSVPVDKVEIQGGVPMLPRSGALYPMVDLGRFLGFSGSGAAFATPRKTVVVVKFRDSFLGLVVDKVLRIEEEVVKSSGPYLRGIPFVSGVSILRRGEPCFILNVYDVFQRMSDWREGAEGYQKSASSARKKRVLVADDSITTRTLEKSILERAGYEIVTATSGTEALETASSGEFDLVVTDVEMPGMTGFELTAALRSSTRYRETPVVIVTSLARDEDRKRGIEVGAQAYIVKGTFDQARLVDTVRSLIG